MSIADNYGESGKSEAHIADNVHKIQPQPQEFIFQITVTEFENASKVMCMNLIAQISAKLS